MAEQESLSLQDLSSMVEIIDLCSQRGAFRGEELEAVGRLRGKLANFVGQNASQSETNTENAQDEAEDASNE